MSRTDEIHAEDDGGQLIPDIRPTARAIIIRQGRILLLRKEYADHGERFALPGGAQEPGESLHQALQRECEEEIGTRVEIGPLLHVADFFKQRETEPPTRRHLLEMLFGCQVPSGYLPCNGHRPDKHQVAVLWADLAAVPDMPVFPPYLRACLAGLDEPDRSLYLGRFES